MALKAWYKFEKDFRDYSGNNLDLFQSTGDTPCQFIYQDGRTALLFTSKIQNYINNNHTIDFSKDFSINFWIWHQGETVTIFDNNFYDSNMSQLENAFDIHITATNKFCTRGLCEQTTSNEIKTATWVNVCITAKGDKVKIFFNNTKVFEGNKNTTSINNNRKVISFHRKQSGELGNSYLSDFRIYDEALDEQAIKEIYEKKDNNGLIAHYSFDNGSLESKVWNKNPLSVLGTTTPSYPLFVSHEGVQLDGDCWLVSQDEILNGEEECSISFWVKKHPGTWFGNIICIGQNRYFRIRIESDGHLCVIWDIDGAGFRQRVSNFIILDNKIYHIVCVVKGDNVIIYVNVEKQTLSASGSVSNSHYDSNRLVIGGLTTSSTKLETFNGVIDEVKIFNRCISESEVVELYNEYLIYSYPENKRKIFHCNFNDNLIDEVSGLELSNYGVGFNRNGIQGSCTYSRSINNRIVFEDKLFSSEFNINELSCATWIKITDDSDWQVINSMGWTSYFRFSKRLDKLMVSIHSNAEFINVEIGDVLLEKWCHIAFSYNNGKLDVYYNGVKTNSITTGTCLIWRYMNGQIPKLTLHHITQDKTSNEGFIGCIDDFRIYNYALSKEEVMYVYNEFKTINPNQELVAWYPLRGDTLDYSGNGLHGRIYDMTWTSGKFGKSLVSNTDLPGSFVSGVRPIDIGIEEGTVAFWFYADEPKEYTVFKILRVYDEDLNNSSYRTIFDLFLKGATGIHINNVNTLINVNDILTLNDWNHISLSYKDKECFVYANGIMVHTVSCEKKVGHNMTSEKFFMLNNSQNASYRIKGIYHRYNDLRFYNCCLTPQEIKELYNSKILSYTFDDPTVECVKNLASDSTDKLRGQYGITLVYKGEENGYSKYGLSGTWTGGDYPYSIRTPNMQCREGRPITASMEIYTNVPNKFDKGSDVGPLNYLFQLFIVNDANMTGKKRSYMNGRLSVIEDVIHSKDLSNGIFLYSKPISDNMTFNPETDFIFVRNIMVSETDRYVPYTPQAFPIETSVVWDNSGYNNHGTTELETTPHFIRSDLLPTTKGMIGNSAIRLKNGQSFKHPNPFLGQDKFEQEWTVNTWVYLKNDNGSFNSSIYLNNFNKGNRLVQSTNNQSLLYLNDGVNDYYVYSKTIPTNEWCMYTFVFRNKDGLREIYKNGKIHNRDAGLNRTFTPYGIPDIVRVLGEIEPDTQVFCSSYEIFATALSSDEINNLYTQAFTITKDYKMYGEGIIENSDSYIEELDNYNLVNNGFLQSKDNTSFPGFTYIPNDGPGIFGISSSLQAPINKRLVLSEIELYPDCQYEFRISVKSEAQETAYCYFGAYSYDKYGEVITTQQISGNTDNALQYEKNKIPKKTIRAVKKGDTEIFLDTVEGIDYLQTTHNSIGICLFEDAPNGERYSHTFKFSSVDKTNNKVILTTGITIDIPIGTRVGMATSGAQYAYMVYIIANQTWKNNTAVRDSDFFRFSCRYFRPFLWLPISGGVGKHQISAISIINKTKPQLPPINYEIKMGEDSVLRCTNLIEGLTYGRNSIRLTNVSLPAGDDYLSSMYKHPNGKKFFCVLNENSDGTKDIQIPVWCDYINGELYMRVFRHDNHSGTLVFDTTEQAKFNEIDDIFGHRYSILSFLDYFKNEDDKYHFLMRYPHESSGYTRPDGTPKYNEWVQNNNPLSSSIIDTHSFINVDMPKMNGDLVTIFRGLGLSTSQSCLLDGDGEGSNYWYLCIGAINQFSGGIPGEASSNNIIKNDVEVWVKVNKNIQNLVTANMYRNGEIRVKEFREDHTSNVTGKEYDKVIDYR